MGSEDRWTVRRQRSGEVGRPRSASEDSPSREPRPPAEHLRLLGLRVRRVDGLLQLVSKLSDLLRGDRLPALQVVASLLQDLVLLPDLLALLEQVFHVTDVDTVDPAPCSHDRRAYQAGDWNGASSWRGRPTRRRAHASWWLTCSSPPSSR